MPNKNFRESKYLNESGTKKGNWYLNRLDYFQFNEYPEYKKHKAIALFLGILAIYLGYIALLSFNLLRTKICRYKGYFIYPTKFILCFRAREVEIDMEDFDSVATMNQK